MALIRQAQIHVFGILLHTGDDTEKDELFYRSLMQPILEESGNVGGYPGLPTGEFKCGENATGENRTYATGAFLEAQSAADVAFAFMQVPAIVSGGTQIDCDGNGEFFVDPGIGQIEFASDARKWSITNANGKVVAQSAAPTNTGSTGKISVPKISKPEVWFFNAAGASYCSQFVYPELYLELHQKSLITDRPSLITGQFVHSLTSNEKADLSVFKSVGFTAQVDGQDFPTSLNEKTGSFEIRGYTPKLGVSEAKVSAVLTLESEHYLLEPIAFEEVEKVYPSAALPEVGRIKFTSPLEGADGKAQASVLIKAPTDKTVGTSRVCFDKTEVISDRQNEFAGKATDRTKSWKWSTKGLDSKGCVTLQAGSGQSTEIQFSLSNKVQADSEGQALFEYSLTSATLQQVKDSQTARFSSSKVTSGPLFWLWLLIFLALGLGIPFLILTLINSRNARLIIGPNVYRGQFKVMFDEVSKSLSLDPEGSALTDAMATSMFFPINQSAGKLKQFVDPPFEVQGFSDGLAPSLKMSVKQPIWPLSPLQFYGTYLGDGITVLAGALIRGQNEPVSGVQKINGGRIDRMAYLTFPVHSALAHRANGSSIPGVLVCYSRNPVIDPEVNRDVVLSALSDSVAIERLTIELAKIENSIAQPAASAWGSSILSNDTLSDVAGSSGEALPGGFSFGFGQDPESKDF